MKTRRKKVFILVVWFAAVVGLTQLPHSYNYDQPTLAQNDDNGPQMQWSQTYGGADSDSANDMIQTSDGGFVLAGSTSEKMYLVKTQENGEIQWERALDKSSGHSIVETSDGGFLFAGILYGGAFRGRFHLIKLDVNGETQWNKTLEWDNTLDPGDAAVMIIQTSDGGFALSGGKGGYKNRPSPWLIKIDLNGGVEWNQTYSVDSWVTALLQTPDGGFALLNINGLLKTDPEGILQWNQTYSRISSHGWNAFSQTIDGGFILAGSKFIAQRPISGTDGFGNDQDMWLAKTNVNGEIQWNETYGGTGVDIANDIIQTTDGGFLLAGSTSTFGLGSQSRDMWLVKTDGSGDKLWDQTYGGSEADSAESVILTLDGGIVLAGSRDGDMWLIKLTYEDVGSNFDLRSVFVGGIVLIISTLGGGYYFIKQRNLRKLLGWIPNQGTKKTLSLIFNGKMSKYLYLMAGISQLPTDQDLEIKIPKAMFDYKFLMHPVRLAMMKILVEHHTITTRKLKNQLGLTWGEISHHLPNLKKNNLIEIEDRFSQGITMQTIIVTKSGSSEFESLVKILQEFLGSSNFDTFPMDFVGGSRVD
ncbi:MAG: transcriptional regulator [Candidatus Heimdallarchaeota archaeon]|nr:transcriptional regulator [Candidatus Heimdallarchaeota archaeon]